MKKHDKVQYNEQVLKIHQNRYTKRLYIETDQGVKWISDIETELTMVEQYHPSLDLGGASVKVYELITDNNMLVYADIMGVEAAVRAVTAQIMQGNIKRGEHYLRYSEDMLNLYKDGNRRFLRPLSDGQARAVVFQSRCEPSTGMHYFLGKNDGDVYTAFLGWLENISLPRICALNDRANVDLEEQLFNEIKTQEYLEELKSLNGTMVGYKLNPKLVEDEYALMRDLMVQTIKKHTRIEILTTSNLTQRLPKSPFLTTAQVKAIYEKLNSPTMPKTYDLDGVEFKPIGVKLFNNNMTAYIVEADRGDEGELQGLHPQAFGYMENLSYPECSEWGYINVEELITCGFEMDLYCQWMYIDGEGNIDTLDKFTQKRHDQFPSCPKCKSKASIEHQESIDGYNFYTCVDCGTEIKTCDLISELKPIVYDGSSYWEGLLERFGERHSISDQEMETLSKMCKKEKTDVVVDKDGNEFTFCGTQGAYSLVALTKERIAYGLGLDKYQKSQRG